MYKDVKCFAIIVAGGKGERFGGDKPKQILPLGGIPILGHSMVSFQQNSCVDQIILVTPKELWDFCYDLSKELGITKLRMIIRGGESRQQSVYNGLLGLRGPQGWASNGLVLVHDAARPFVPCHESIKELLNAAYHHYAATFAVPATDTIKTVDSHNMVKSTLQRDRTFLIQTPQAFWSNILRRAHKKARKAGFEAYDDCQLAENIGIKPKVIESSPDNIKITHAVDMVLAEEIYENRLKVF
jgi:2-C-methyl-D-erythritol 4-phosphate cytidylyltransferase